MLNILKTYKHGILTVLFAVYSLGLWHICSNYTDSKYTKERLELTQKALDTTNARLELAKMIGAQLDEKLAKRAQQTLTLKREVIHEIQTQPVYTDCRTTPDGVRLIEQAIDAGYTRNPSGTTKMPADSERR